MALAAQLIVAIIVGAVIGAAGGGLSLLLDRLLGRQTVKTYQIHAQSGETLATITLPTDATPAQRQAAIDHALAEADQKWTNRRPPLATVS